MGEYRVVVSLDHSVLKLLLPAAVRPKQKLKNTMASNTDGRYFNTKCLKIQYFFVTLPTQVGKTDRDASGHVVNTRVACACVARNNPPI
jgi:hypothetical protein